MRDAASDRTAAAFGRIRCGSQWLWEKSADSDGGDGNADDDITNDTDDDDADDGGTSHQCYSLNHHTIHIFIASHINQTPKTTSELKKDLKE